MEEKDLSWRAKLAKANINILNLDGDLVNIEFTYHPKPGVFKWCKTVYVLKWDNDAELGDQILKRVLALRKELEG